MRRHSTIYLTVRDKSRLHPHIALEEKRNADVLRTAHRHHYRLVEGGTTCTGVDGTGGAIYPVGVQLLVHARLFIRTESTADSRGSRARGSRSLRADIHMDQ